MQKRRRRKPAKKQISVRIMPDTLDELDRIADQKGADRAEIVRHLIENYVAEQNFNYS